MSILQVTGRRLMVRQLPPQPASRPSGLSLRAVRALKSQSALLATNTSQRLARIEAQLAQVLQVLANDDHAVRSHDNCLASLGNDLRNMHGTLTTQGQFLVSQVGPQIQKNMNDIAAMNGRMSAMGDTLDNMILAGSQQQSQSSFESQ